MPRYPHLLRAAKPGTYPTQILALAAEYGWVETDERPPTREAFVRRWAGLGARGKCGVYGPNHAAEGEGALSLWAAIDRQLSKGGVTWCFSADAARLWAAVDLWGMIERGEVSITGSDYRYGTGTACPAVPQVRDAQHTGTQSVRNGCESDLHGLPGGIPRAHPGARSDGDHRSKRRLGYLVLESPPFVCDIRRLGRTGTLRIVDIANYGAAIAPAMEAAGQGAADTMAFVRGMIAALLARNLGGLKATVGSQAMTAFATGYLTHPMEVHCDEQALGIEGRGYYGGRCEAFTLGVAAGRVWHVDVSAMYASVCATAHVPVSLACVRPVLSADDLGPLSAEQGVIADVTLTVSEPCFPYACPRRGITIWPVGTLNTTLAGEELCEAFRMGAVESVHRAAYYICAPALKAYAEMALALRDFYPDSPALRGWAKAMGNALPGKFGQKDRRWVDDWSPGFDGPWDAWGERDERRGWERWRCVAWRVQREEVSGWAAEAVPAAAAFITAAARMRLLTMIRCAGWENVHYCDTDSLMVSDDGMERLTDGGFVRPGAPGFLRVDGTFDRVWIGGIKDYTEDGARTKAGVKKGTLAEGQQEGAAWVSVTVGDHCRSKRSPRAVIHRIDYLAGGVYRHGIRGRDGRVAPHRLGGMYGEEV